MASASKPPHKRILVVDDEPDLRTLYELTLVREGFVVEAAGSVREARQCLQDGRFDVVITDMRLPDGLGLHLLEQIRTENRPERCVVITAYGSADNAVECLKAGAFDYLTKPVDLKQFRTVIASAVQDSDVVLPAAIPGTPASGRAGNARGNLGASAEGGAGGNLVEDTGAAALSRLIGNSPAMHAVRERIARIAKSMAPVLVRGESGTGKELAARALHANSHRHAGAWVAVNCSAIPENLLESEFFGSKKGSYTGAHQDRDGFFQSASGGTLFLDEIGDLPLAMQAKLLRAIQERCVRPVGGAQEEPVNVRIVSATHKDLAQEVASGQFRQDLYYRLNVIDIFIPPLRERLEDLPQLCQALLARIARDTGMSVPAMAPRMIDQLALEPLRGNVRELENLLHRAVALSEGRPLEFDHSADSTLPLPLTAAQQSPPAPSDSAALSEATLNSHVPNRSAPSAQRPAGTLAGGNLQAYLDQHERDILIQVLRETGFNRTAAATRLGMSLRQMRYRIARLNIDMPGGHDAHE